MSLESEEMVAVPIREFLAGANVPVDLFVRLGESKFVMIAKEDAKAALDQLKSLEQKNVSELFIRKQDFSRYVSSTVVIAGVSLTARDISSAQKADFLAKASVSVMKEIEIIGMSLEAYEHCKLVAAATTTLVESKGDLFQLLRSLSTVADHLMAHSVAVSAVSVMIGKGMGWTKPATFEKVCLGGLLHDVGLKEIPTEILNKTRAQMSYEEVQLYEGHSFRSMEILRTLPSVPDDVVAIAFEHHENAIGQGFPRKLRDLRMNPLAKVVALADCFVDLTIKNVNFPNPKTAAEAVAYIDGIMGQPFNREAFAALRILVLKSQGKTTAA